MRWDWNRHAQEILARFLPRLNLISMRFDTPRKGRFFFQQVCAWLGGLCFVLGFLAPNHYLPWPSFHNEAPIFFAVIFLCLGTMLGPRIVVVPAKALLLTVAIASLIVVQWASGQIYFFGDALLSILFIVTAGISWWLGAQQAVTAAEFNKIVVGVAVVVVAAATLSSGIAVVQWLNLEEILGIFAVERPYLTRPSGNLAQPNLLATLIVMSTVLAFFLRAQQRLQRWQAALLVVFFSFTLVATESRQGLLSTLCVGAFLLWQGRHSIEKNEWKFVGLWWGAVFACVWLWTPLNEVLLLQAPREMVAHVDSVRITLWKQALSAIAQSPWVGYGWRQTAVAQKFGVLTVPSDVITDYAHNVVLDILCWVGLPFGVVLLAVVALRLWKIVSRTQGQIQTVLLAVTIPFFVHSMLEFPFVYAFFLFPVAAVFGALEGLQMPAAFRTEEEGAPKRLIRFFFLSVFAVGCSGVFLEYLKVEEDMRVMRFELRRLGTAPSGYAQPQLSLLTQMDQMLKLGRMEVSRGMSPADLDRMKRANLVLSWATLHLKYVVALAVNGRSEEAEYQLGILKGLYGPQTYRQAVAELMFLSQTKFPELTTLRDLGG